MFLSSSPSVIGFQQFFFILSRVAYVANPTEFISAYANKNHTQGPTYSKADIRNPLSLLAHERSRFATCVQFIYGQFVNLRMQHNRYYAISLCACVARGPSCALADFRNVNRKNEEFCQGKRFSERLSFTRFCANGNRPAFIEGGSERDETAVK